jgi:hypothetical protein
MLVKFTDFDSSKTIYVNSKFVYTLREDVEANTRKELTVIELEGKQECRVAEPIEKVAKDLKCE